MLRRSREQTDHLLDLLDPEGTLALRVLIEATREANGALPFREHDFQAILERLRGRALERLREAPEGNGEILAGDLAEALIEAGGGDGGNGA